MSLHLHWNWDYLMELSRGRCFQILLAKNIISSKKYITFPFCITMRKLFYFKIKFHFKNSNCKRFILLKLIFLFSFSWQDSHKILIHTAGSTYSINCTGQEN